MRSLLEVVAQGVQSLLPRSNLDSFGHYLSHKSDTFFAFVKNNSTSPLSLSVHSELCQLLFEVMVVINSTSILPTSVKGNPFTPEVSAAVQDRYFISEESHAVSPLNDSELTPAETYISRVDVATQISSITRDSLMVLLMVGMGPIKDTLVSNRSTLTSILLSFLPLADSAIRVNISQSLGMLCLCGENESQTQDFITLIARSLLHKILPPTTMSDKAVLGLKEEGIVAAGALKCLQVVTATLLIHGMNSSVTGSGVMKEVLRMYNITLERIKSIVDRSNLAIASNPNLNEKLLFIIAVDSLDGYLSNGLILYQYQREGSLPTLSPMERTHWGDVWIRGLQSSAATLHAFSGMIDPVQVRPLLESMYELLQATDDPVVRRKLMESCSRLAVFGKCFMLYNVTCRAQLFSSLLLMERCECDRVPVGSVA